MFIDNQLYGFLEMAAILCNIKEGDEVIMPSYTFVSTANAFVLRGAKIVFIDSQPDHPGMDAEKIEELITIRTRIIVPVHYAGIACDMDKIMALAKKYNLFVVEDAAQSIDSYYISPNTGEKKVLGSIGHIGCFSFHETKNIQCGEGGMIVLNSDDFFQRAEILWEKGTNRAAFFRGEVDKYSWVDIGSSFLQSDLLAAFLYSQLENINAIQEKRKNIWTYYYTELKNLEDDGLVKLPVLSKTSTNNGHLFYMVLNSNSERNEFIQFMRKNGVYVTFHYQSLHKSSYFLQKEELKKLNFAEYYSNNLIRLPLYFEVEVEQQNYIINKIYSFYRKTRTFN